MSGNKEPDFMDEENVPELLLKGRHSGKKAHTQMYQSAQFENVSQMFGRDSGRAQYNSSNNTNNNSILNNMSFDNYNSNLTERLMNKSGMIFQNGNIVNIAELDENDSKDDRIRELQLRELQAQKKLREVQAKLEKDSAVLTQRLEFTEFELNEAKKKIKDSDEFFKQFDLDDLKYQQHPALKQKFSQMAEVHAKELSAKQREIDQLRFQLRTTVSGQNQKRKVMRSSIDSIGSEKISVKKTKLEVNESESEEDIRKEIVDTQSQELGDQKQDRLEGQEDKQKIQGLERQVQELMDELKSMRNQGQQQQYPQIQGNTEITPNGQEEQGILSNNIEDRMQQVCSEEQKNILIQEQKLQIQEQLKEIDRIKSELIHAQGHFERQLSQLDVERKGLSQEVDAMRQQILNQKKELKEIEEKGKKADAKMSTAEQMLLEIEQREKNNEDQQETLKQYESQLHQQMKVMEAEKNMLQQDISQHNEEKQQSLEQQLQFQADLEEFARRQDVSKEEKDQLQDQQDQFGTESKQNEKNDLDSQQKGLSVEHAMAEIEQKEATLREAIAELEEERARIDLEQKTQQDLFEELNIQRLQLKADKELLEQERVKDEESRNQWYTEQVQLIETERQKLIVEQEQFEKNNKIISQAARNQRDQENLILLQQEQLQNIEQQLRNEAAEQIEQVQECLEREWLSKLEFYEKKHSEILEETNMSMGQQLKDKENEIAKERQIYKGEIDSLKGEIQRLSRAVSSQEEEGQMLERLIEIKQKEIDEIRQEGKGINKKMQQQEEDFSEQIKKQQEDTEISKKMIESKYQSDVEAMRKHIEQLEGLLVSNRDAYYEERAALEGKIEVCKGEWQKEREELEAALKQEREEFRQMRNGIEEEKLEVEEMKGAVEQELERVNQMKVEIEEERNRMNKYRNDRSQGERRNDGLEEDGNDEVGQNEESEERIKRSIQKTNNPDTIQSSLQTRHNNQLKGQNILTDIQEELEENGLQTPSKRSVHEVNPQDNKDRLLNVQRGKNQSKDVRLQKEEDRRSDEFGKNQKNREMDEQMNYVDGECDEQSLSEQERQSFDAPEEAFKKQESRKYNQLGNDEKQEDQEMQRREQQQQELMRQIEEQFDLRVGQLEDEKEQLISTIQQLQSQLIFQTDKHNNLMHHCSQLEVEEGAYEDQEKQIESLQNMIAELQLDASNAKKDVDRKERKISELLQQIHVLEINRKEIMDDLDQEQDRFLQQIRNCRESQLVQTHEGQINSQKNVAALISERDDLKARVQELEANSSQVNQMQRHMETAAQQQQGITEDTNWSQQQINHMQTIEETPAVLEAYPMEGEDASDGYSLPFFSQQVQWDKNIRQTYDDDHFTNSNQLANQSAEFESIHQTQSVQHNARGDNQYQASQPYDFNMEMSQKQHQNNLNNYVQGAASHERVMSEGFPGQGRINSHREYNRGAISSTTPNEISSYSDNNANNQNSNPNDVGYIQNNFLNRNGSNFVNDFSGNNNTSNSQTLFNSAYQNRSRSGAQSLHQSRIVGQFQYNDQPLFGSLNHSSLFGLSQAQMLEIIERAYVQRISQQQAYYEERLRKGNVVSERGNSVTDNKTRMQNENEKLKRELSEMKKSRTLELERQDIKGREQQLLADTAKLCLQKQPMKKSSTNNSQFLDTSGNNLYTDSFPSENRRRQKKSISITSEVTAGTTHSHAQLHSFATSLLAQSQMLNEQNVAGQVQSNELEQDESLSHMYSPYSKAKNSVLSSKHERSRQPTLEQFQHVRLEQYQQQSASTKHLNSSRPLENLYSVAKEAAEANKKKRNTAGSIVTRPTKTKMLYVQSPPPASALDLVSPNLTDNSNIHYGSDQQSHSSRIEQQLQSVSSAVSSLTQQSSKSASSISSNYFHANTARSMQNKAAPLEIIPSGIGNNKQNMYYQDNTHQFVTTSATSQTYLKSTLSTESSNIVKTAPNSKNYSDFSQKPINASNQVYSVFPQSRDTTPTQVMKKSFLHIDEPILATLGINRMKRSITETKLFNPSGILQRFHEK